MAQSPQEKRAVTSKQTIQPTPGVQLAGRLNELYGNLRKSASALALECTLAVSLSAAEKKKMFAHLAFSESKFSMFVKIGEANWLRDADIRPFIPAEYSKQYQLSLMGKPQVLKLIKAKALTLDTPRAELELFRKQLDSQAEPVWTASDSGVSGSSGADLSQAGSDPLSTEEDTTQPDETTASDHLAVSREPITAKDDISTSQNLPEVATAPQPSEATSEPVEQSSPPVGKSAAGETEPVLLATCEIVGPLPAGRLDILNAKLDEIAQLEPSIRLRRPADDDQKDVEVYFGNFRLALAKGARKALRERKRLLSKAERKTLADVKIEEDMKAKDIAVALSKVGVDRAQFEQLCDEVHSSVNIPWSLGDLLQRYPEPSKEARIRSSDAPSDVASVSPADEDDETVPTPEQLKRQAYFQQHL